VFWSREALEANPAAFFFYSMLGDPKEILLKTVRLTAQFFEKYRIYNKHFAAATPRE
jgi:hypothetical protein